MADEISVSQWLFASAMAAGTAVIGFLMKRSIRQQDDEIAQSKRAVEQLRNDHGRLISAGQLDLANFKTEVAKEYAKETTVQASLARIHERIDQIGDKMDDGFEELRDDIKELLGRPKK